MPTHDIIDNRKEKLVDHINRILSSTESARFAVGYFFLSGLESIAQRLAGVKELRLLIGNTTNRETLEQLAEGYRRLGPGGGGGGSGSVSQAHGNETHGW